VGGARYSEPVAGAAGKDYRHVITRPEEAQMVKLSKPFYVISIVAVQFIAAAILVGFSWWEIYTDFTYNYGGEEDVEIAAPRTSCALALVALITGLLAIYAFIVSLVMWYKAWDAVSGLETKPQPFVRVILLLVPVFNLYWQFRVYWLWAKAYNAMTEKLGRPEATVNEKAFLALPASTILAFVIAFLLGSVNATHPTFSRIGRALLETALLPYCGLLWYVVAKVCDAVKGLAARAANTSARSTR